MIVGIETIAVAWLALFGLCAVGILVTSRHSGAWADRPSRAIRITDDASRTRACDSAATIRNLNTIRSRARATAGMRSVHGGMSTPVSTR